MGATPRRATSLLLPEGQSSNDIGWVPTSLLRPLHTNGRDSMIDPVDLPSSSHPSFLNFSYLKDLAEVLVLWNNEVRT